MRRSLFLLPIFLLSVLSGVYAQELNCTVQVISQKIQSADQKIFKTLETSVYEFMNNRKWTNDVFAFEERIECTILINVVEEMGSDKYKAKVTVQSSRPALNSSYNSVLLNYADNDWVFNYVEYQPLDFNENTFTTNLTSMLGFYAYMIIALDYDSFSKKGGDPYFSKAEAIVNGIPTSLTSDDAPGWKPFDGNRNRYWMVENMMNTKYSAMRDAMYSYYREGMDMMYENPTLARKNVTNSLEKMKQVVQDNPNSMIAALFFNDSKADELVNIFSQAAPSEKAAVIQILYKVDPTNSSKYSQMMK